MIRAGGNPGAGAMEAPMAYQMGILIPSRLETVISIFRIGSSFFLRAMHSKAKMPEG